MNKRTFLAICTAVLMLLCVAPQVCAQNISVASFRLDERDLTANLQGTTVHDQNGDKCALIRIKTTETGFSFDVGTLGIMKVEYHTAEVWVYVPFGARRISISHSQLGSTTYEFPVAIERARTYVMQLTTGQVQTIVHQAVTSQYVLFRVEPKDAMVEIDGQMLDVVEGTASKRLPFGTYSYRVVAARYAAYSGSVTVNDPNRRAVVEVKLTPQFKTVRLTAPSNAEIWVDDKLLGRGSVSTELGFGTYLAESRLAGHRAAKQELVVSATSPVSVALRAPTPIYGSMDVNSVPADAAIWLDGVNIGTTPMYISQALIGEHKLQLKKSGYKDYSATVTVREGQTETLNAALEKGFATDGRTFTVNGVSFEMVAVEGGTFTMGATSEQGSDAYGSEKPIHQVTLSNFSIGKTEVTQALWRAVMGTTVRQQRDKVDASYSLCGEGDNYPMYYVNWNDCQEFIRRLNQLTGQNFRLPTEAEWEYAARGGRLSRGYKYSGSNDINSVAWYWDNSGSKTHSVATKQPNELGIYDMSGNVWEWCSDWYGNYSSGAQTNPKGASTGSYRVIRCGSWSHGARYCRVSYRYYSTPSNRLSYIGLRLLLGQ